MFQLAIIDLAEGHEPAELAPLREAEDAAVKALVAKGIVTQPFMRGDRPGAIFVTSGDAAEVRAALLALPAVGAGIITLTELIPLNPHAAHPNA